MKNLMMKSVVLTLICVVCEGAYGKGFLVKNIVYGIEVPKNDTLAEEGIVFNSNGEGVFAEGGDIIVNSLIPLTCFEDFCGSGYAIREIQMKTSPVQNLMIKDPVTGEIISVGLDGTDWHIGFMDDQGYFDGWGQNDLVDFSGWEGWINGTYTSFLDFDSDKKPNEIYIINDVNKDGIGVFDTSTNSWILGSDDVLYTSKDVLFGPSQIRGDVSQLPAWDVGSSVPLPEMIISVYVTQYYDMDELTSIATNWLSCGCEESNSYCNGADLNLDGNVDLLDFAFLNDHWLESKD